MSSAFLKNETADDPVVIPARAPLPPGMINYVTPHGLTLLRDELTELESERATVSAGALEERDRSRQLAELNGRIGLLNQRIATAKVVEEHPALDEVRFGATVTLKPRPGKTNLPERKLNIVGVDEADANHGLIAFTAPIVRTMQGKRVGDPVTVPTRTGTITLVIAAIDY